MSAQLIGKGHNTAASPSPGTIPKDMSTSPAGVVAFDQLIRKLKRFGYEPMPQTPGLWRHTSRKTTFTLFIDDFGIQYFSKSDADHLIDAIQDTYECSIDWKGTQYCGLTLAWNYPKTPRTCPARLDSPHLRPTNTTTGHTRVYRTTSPTCRKSTSPRNHRDLSVLWPQH